jgi:hypothetical protein
MVKQYSVFLENAPGRLSNLMDILEANKIKVLALGIAEAGNYGIVRMIVDNDEKAIEVMKQNNIAVNQAEVIIADLESLPRAVHVLGENKINIDYAYTMDCSKVVLKVDDVKKAIEALSNAGISTYASKC